MYWSGISAAANAAAAYQTGQPGYVVGHTPAAGTYTAQRAPSTYDASYQTAPSHTSASYPPPSTTYDYGYTARPPTQPAAAPAAVYDTSKTYYSQPAAAVAAPVTVATPYTATDTTHYQSGNLRQSTTTAAAAAAAPKTSYAGGYSVSSAPQTAYNTTAYTAQASSAAQANKGSTNYTQPSTQTTSSTSASFSTSSNSNTWQARKSKFVRRRETKQAHKAAHKAAQLAQQQLHYCDVCKISCAGPAAYREHLEGQKHKKKEAAAKAGPTNCRTSIRCELCDVTCTGMDAYAAHIIGAKHCKVVKLHQKLGKEIPEMEPVVVPGSSSSKDNGKDNGKDSGKDAVKDAVKDDDQDDGKDSSKDSTAKNDSTDGKSLGEKKDECSGEGEAKDDQETKEDEMEPVGQEYIEEIRAPDGDNAGKLIGFNCKLCDCRFTNPKARSIHMNGRRHRLQYKKKVDKELPVKRKGSGAGVKTDKLRRRRRFDERLGRYVDVPDPANPRRLSEEERVLEEEERWLLEEWRRYEEEGPGDYMDWCRRRYPHRPPGAPPPHMGGPPGMAGPPRPFIPGQMLPMMMRRLDTSDDRHAIAKHTEIYPLEDELLAIQKIVSTTEKALKLVSDFLSDLDIPEDAGIIQEEKDSKISNDATPTKDKKDATVDEKDDESATRKLKGVMRVGILAKGLLLRGDKRVELVVLCGEKPTRTLLDRVADALPQHLAAIAPNEHYDVQRVVENAALDVTYQNHTVTVTLTAPVMREQMLQQKKPDSQVGVKDAPDVLDKQKCLDALAALRHAKWFKARANGLQSCVMVIRIMRDLCQRLDSWAALGDWCLEVICEKVLGSAGHPISPGDGLRRLMEAISSGLLLPGSPGLLDPCEKDPLDAAVHLTPQQREEITASAQHALRLISFRQIHKVLGIDQILPPKFQRNNRFTRKRRRVASDGDGGDSGTEQDGSEGKKDKKEESIESSVSPVKSK